MEKTTILSLGKYTSIIVMLLTGAITAITLYSESLATLDYGRVVIALGVFLVAIRNYLKDKNGVM